MPEKREIKPIGKKKQKPKRKKEFWLKPNEKREQLGKEKEKREL